MNFNTWLQSLPEQDNIDVAENPQFMRLLREAYARGKIDAETAARQHRDTVQKDEAVLKRAQMR